MSVLKNNDFYDSITLQAVKQNPINFYSGLKDTWYSKSQNLQLKSQKFGDADFQVWEY